MSERNSIKKLEFVITDKDGKSVRNGDNIIVQLPSHEHTNHDGDYEIMSGKLVLCNLRLQLSRGLVIRIIEILADDDLENDAYPIYERQVIIFRRISWDWWKV